MCFKNKRTKGECFMEEKIYSAKVLNERLQLSFFELLLVILVKKARVIPTQELEKYDLYTKLKQEFWESGKVSKNKLRILVNFYEELTGEVTVQSECPIRKKMTLKKVKNENRILAKTLQIYKEISADEEERYCTTNLARILASIYVYFETGHSKVGLFYSNSGVDFQSIARQIQACSEKDYYVFANNLLDEDELSMFGNFPMSGVVVSKGCPLESLRRLVKANFQARDICDVYILPVD